MYSVLHRICGAAKKERVTDLNYQKELEKVLANIITSETIPKLLLHSCCAPCSSYVLEYLSKYFEITIFYYNPNIFPKSEYKKRVCEQQQFLRDMQFQHPVLFLEGDYDRERFFEIARGLERLEEGKERCFKCYELRLAETARIAREGGFDYFTTTLSISPMKNAGKLNEIGARIAGQTGVSYLHSDFKKKNGYKRSIELSKEYGLYRQDYCGCEFSRRTSTE